MARHSRRRNRIVKPFRGQLFDMVVKNFAYVAIPDSMGRPVKDKSGKIKRSRRKEVINTFSTYYNLCLVDEYFKMLYESMVNGDKEIHSTMKKDFSDSWKYLLRRFSLRAPRGMRETALRVEKRLSEVDEVINEGISKLNSGSDLRSVLADLKKVTRATEFKRLIEYYADYLKDTFTMFGMNVQSEVKNNPKFNIRYIQFSEGDEISEIISQSSAVISGKVEKAAKLKKLRDAKLKSSLLKEGYHVETQPYFVKDKGMAYLTVAYDAQATQVPKPRSKPNFPEFKQREYDLITNLESLVKDQTIYGTGVDPKEFFIAPKCSIQYNDNGRPSLVYKEGEKEKNEELIEIIKSARSRAYGFSFPEYKEGFGLKPNGEPEAGYHTKGILAGKPRFRYKVPKTKLKKYTQAVKVFTKILQFRSQCENLASHAKEVFKYKQQLKPFIRGVYSNEFTDELGTSYIRFNSMKRLAKKIIEKREARSLVKNSEPTISERTILVDDYPVWKGGKITYGERKIRIAEFNYGRKVSYNPIHHKDLLKEALQRINLGRSRDSLTPEQEARILTPKFREIKGTDGITKTLQLCTLKDSEGNDIEIVVSGRYAGYELDVILNMEGRFFEGGYHIKDIQTGESRKVALPRMVFDEEGNVSTLIENELGMDKWEYEQRLVEPYISLNPVTKKLVLGIPGGTMGTADRNLMRGLSKEISTINEKRDPNIKSKRVQSLNPFFTFEPEDFETIRETLGSVAMSATATNYIDEYYESLRAKENSMSVENTERFTPESLGGFVQSTARGSFKFSNKQREAAAWLEASNMRGVIALDTGVGKTLTALMAIKNAINEEMEQGGKERRFLYVSPKSLVGNLKGEVKAFMVEGGETFIREDGVEEKVPNWKKIVLSRIDEVSYEDFVSRFKDIEDIEGELLKLEDGPKLTSDAKRLNREIKHKGEVATITYEIGYKDGQEVWKNEIDFEIGNTLDVNRTASTKPKADDIRISKELVSYPSLNASQEKEKKKTLSETRKSINAHKRDLKVKQFPEVNKYFENQYHACFFDEINEIFSGKGKASKNYAVSSLSHPRKVFLTASALDRDPIDLYRLSTLAKGSIPTKKSEKSFAEKYGNVIAGRMVGLKPNSEVRTQFYNWVKENAYFSPKMDISVDARFGVDYKDVGLPSLQELYSRTITTQMSPSVEEEYRKEAKKISGELKAMLSKYRDLKDQLSTLQDTHGDLFDSTKSKTYQDLTLATGKVKKALKELTKISSKVEGKVDVATRLLRENRKSRFLYFCTDKVLARKVAKSNSKADKSSVHALLWDNDITFYRNGKKVAGVKAKDKMSLKDFDLTVDQDIWTDIRVANEEEEIDPTWAMAISKKYVKNNATLTTAVCSDSYARGFNFQTFDKVVHLDRGDGFDSELLKQRTARAYRGGQAKKVEEIFIDATFTQDSETSGTISDEAKTKVDHSLVLGLERRELVEGNEYQEWIWSEDEWIEAGSSWKYPKAKKNQNPDASYLAMMTKINSIFSSMGYVLPIENEDGTTTKKVVLNKGVEPKELANVSQDIDMISIDQLKSLVNKADQDFFQDIIYNGLKSDLTARIDGRSSDTGIAIKTPDMLGFILNPTIENRVRVEKQLADYEENPINHIHFSPTRYDQAGLWLNENIQPPVLKLSDSQKEILDMVGGPTVVDYALGGGSIEIEENGTAFITVKGGRFVTYSEVSINKDHIYNSDVNLTSCAPRGFSSKFLFSQIVVAKRTGKKYIELYAGGQPGSLYSGYAVWPKFGFDCVVDVNKILEKAGDSIYAVAVKEVYGYPGSMNLQKLLSVCADIVTMGYNKDEMREYKEALLDWNARKELNESNSQWVSQNPMPTKPEKKEVKVEERVPVGEKLWALYGEGKKMRLDLTDGSSGLKIANRYLRKKSFAKNVEVQDFLNSPSDLFNTEDAWCWEQEIDNVKVRGSVMDWRDVVKQYPEEMRTAWYSHLPLRTKIKTLCKNDKEFKAFMRKYDLVDPYTTFRVEEPKRRGQQMGISEPKEKDQVVRNVRKLGSEKTLTDKDISERKLWEETQDQTMLDIWEEIRLENYVGRVIAEVIEDDVDPDLIEIQKLRGEK